MTERVHIDTGTARYVFDAAGRLRFMLDADGAAQSPHSVLYWKYDRLGRPLEAGALPMVWDQALLQSYADEPYFPANGYWHRRLAYDCDDSGGIEGRIGRLYKTEMRSGTDQPEAVVTERYDYDRAGRIIRHMVRISAYDECDYVTDYVYNGLGDVRKIIYPSAGRTILYTYNMLGQIVAVGTEPLSAYYASYSYNADGSVGEEKLGPGLVTRTMHYNSLGWLVKIEDDEFFTEQLCYQDAQGQYLDGNVASAHVQFRTTARFGIGRPVDVRYEYAYDEFGQLIRATGNAHGGNLEEARYDANGNIMGMRVDGQLRSYAYGSQSNRLHDVNGKQFVYTPNGSLQSTAGISEIVYDRLLQLPVCVQANHLEISLQYDSGGERCLKRVKFHTWPGPIGGTEKKTAYLRGVGDYPLIEKRKVGGLETQSAYIYGPGGLIAVFDGENDWFISKDHLGSPRVIFGRDKQARAYYNYGPFGELLAGNSSSDALASSFSRGYTGQEFDSELGLYNFRARWYDPAIGRFYAPDPAYQFASPYVYAGNNPINMIDPTGGISGRALYIGMNVLGLGVMAGGIAASVIAGGVTGDWGKALGIGIPLSLVAGAVTGYGLSRFSMYLRYRSMRQLSNFVQGGRADQPLMIYAKNDFELYEDSLLIANWRGINRANIVPYGTDVRNIAHNNKIILNMHGAEEGGKSLVERSLANGNIKRRIIGGEEIADDLVQMGVFHASADKSNTQWFLDNLACRGGDGLDSTSARMQSRLSGHHQLKAAVKGRINDGFSVSNWLEIWPAGSTVVAFTKNYWISEAASRVGIFALGHYKYYGLESQPGLLRRIFSNY
ncbi:hypothetical protein SD70_07480 [Gordoniibacillus kamchatkensis]|uniref:Teneurin-like YD-shell domain-containing protein n=1 Tax=Gordoniibacillus kamchatkensis TaxID=1590651 RepID=A0ABR5AKC1_9BACL|nr:RHS repeat-associated core domain-containing protein [Paenibacillus sp. VKM B-2647]KIL41464.1 hypothetical protein SD70_07480 [Paenibacillus sp. VKM B-2647]